MMIRRSLLACGLALAMLTGCAAPPKSGDVLSQDQLRSASFYKYWQARMPLREGDAIKECFLVEDSLYVTTAYGNLFAVQADNGLLRWAAELTEPDYEIYRPGHLQTPGGTGPVAIVTTTRLFVYDRYSGDLLHSSPLTMAPGGGAVGDATRLCVVSTDAHAYSLLWKHGFGETPLTRWRLFTGAPITTQPTLDEGTLIFATQGGHVVACTALDKLNVWTAKLGGAFVGDPFVHASGVYVAGINRSLYRLDRHTGRVLWQCRFPRPLKNGPKVVDYTCYQYCVSNGITALDTDTGRQKWQRQDAVALVAALPGEAVIRTTGDMIEVVDNETGKTRRSFDMGDTKVSVSNTDGDSIFLAAADGRILCARPEGVPYLRRQQIEASKAALNRPPASRTESVAVDTGYVEETEHGDPFRSRRDER